MPFFYQDRYARPSCECFFGNEDVDCSPGATPCEAQAIGDGQSYWLYDFTCGACRCPTEDCQRWVCEIDTSSYYSPVDTLPEGCLVR